MVYLQFTCDQERECCALLRKVRQKCSGTRMFGMFISHSYTINPAPSESQSSPKGNDSELSDRNAGQKSGVSRLRVPIGSSRPAIQILTTR